MQYSLENAKNATNSQELDTFLVIYSIAPDLYHANFKVSDRPLF